MSETMEVAIGQARYHRDTDGDWWVAFGLSNGATKWIPIADGEMTRTLAALAAARREVETVRATLTMERDSDREALRMVKREIEAVQSEVRLRGETIDALRREVAGWEERTKKLGSVVLRAWEVLRGWWQFSKLEERDEPFVDSLTRAIAADAEHDAYALGEIRRLNAEVETVTRERDQARAAMLSALLRFGVEFMDPPDGGDVSLEEQVQRMARAFAASRAALEDVRRVATELVTRCEQWEVCCTNVDAMRYDGGTTHKLWKNAYEALGRALAQEAGNGKV